MKFRLAPKHHIVLGFLSSIACVISLSSCGHSSTQSSLTSLPQLKSPGPVTTQVNVKLSDSTPAIFHSGSSPNVLGTGPTYISSGGFIVAAQAIGSKTGIYERLQPKAPWTYLGAVAGVVAQLDFPTLELGFALVQGTGGQAVSLLYATADGGKNWDLVSAAQLSQVHFFDGANGVAAAPSLPGAIHGTEMLLTSDGGRIWTQAANSSFPQQGVYGIRYSSFSFISRQVGWFVFGSQPGTGMQQKWLFETTDGGKDWNQVSASPPFPSPTTTTAPSGGLPIGGYIQQIRFTSSSVGYLVLGRDSRGGALKTVDGGRHWAGIQFLPGAQEISSTAISDLAPSTPYGGIAYTVSGTLWNRANGGSWVLIYPPYRAIDVSHGSGRTVALTVEGRLLQISSKASASFVTLGNFGINGGDASLVPGATVMLTPSTFEVLKSSAKQWSNQPLPKGWSVLSGRFATSKIGALVLGPARPELEATLSGGKSWTKIPLPFSAFSVDPLSATNWWLAGGISHPLVPNPYNKKILIWKYYLYHTTDAGRTWSQFGANWPGMGSLNGVQFISSSVGYTWNENTIFVTTNGGKTFVGHQLSAYYIPGPSSLAVGTGGRAWLASDSYPVFESKDYGSTWSPM